MLSKFEKALRSSKTALKISRCIIVRWGRTRHKKRCIIMQREIFVFLAEPFFSCATLVFPKWKRKSRRKSHSFFHARRVTILPSERTIGQSTSPHANTEWKQMETKKSHRSANTVGRVIRREVVFGSTRERVSQCQTRLMSSLKL